MFYCFLIFQLQQSLKELLWHHHWPLCLKSAMDYWWNIWCLCSSHWFQAIMSEIKFFPLFHTSQLKPRTWTPPPHVSQTTYWQRKAWDLFPVCCVTILRNLLCCVTIKLNKMFRFHLMHVFFFPLTAFCRTRLTLLFNPAYNIQVLNPWSNYYYASWCFIIDLEYRYAVGEDSVLVIWLMICRWREMTEYTHL